MNSLTFLIAKLLNKAELHVNEHPITGLIIFLLVIIFGLPFISALQRAVSEFPYFNFFSMLLTGYHSIFSNTETFILVLLLILLFLFLFILKKMDDSRKIKDNFRGNLAKWSTPLNSSWNTRSSEKGIGKMLVVKDSDHPGLLKGAFGWYDYELTFKAMLPDLMEIRKNLGVFIRAKDSLNGILLQIRENEFVPHYLFEGSYIIDDSQRMRLQTTMPLDTWVNFKITVKGDDVTFVFEGQKIHFKIKGYNVSFVPNNLLYTTTSIREIESTSEKNNLLFNDYLDKLQKLNEKKRENSPDPTGISRLETEHDQSFAEFNKATLNTRQINLDYNQGSVGFRESHGETAYFRELILRKID